MKAWEPDEDQIIMDMHAKEGPKWKLIVKKLPGRTVRYFWGSPGLHASLPGA